MDREETKDKLWQYCVKKVGFLGFFATKKSIALYEKILKYPFSVAEEAVLWEDHERAVSDYNFNKRQRAKELKIKRLQVAKSRRPKKKK